VVGGGGGVPVVRRARHVLEGVEAVIDKDFSAALVATELGADTLAIVTDVPAVAIGFGKPWERWLGHVTVRELEGWLKAGEFEVGSMAPKVEAGIAFLHSGGRRFVITDAPSLQRALRDEAGTRVTQA
ncbi:MAG: carbamate kinase, partial [Thermoplasmata archaeon]|nr:carbamate kinase [Thermoplasmata archaeon]